MCRCYFCKVYTLCCVAMTTKNLENYYLCYNCYKKYSYRIPKKAKTKKPKPKIGRYDIAVEEIGDGKL